MTYYTKKVFTKEELKKYDGSNGLAYVAFRGKIYDVSQSFHWRKGIHQVMHHAGCDLTEALGEAPHGSDMLDKFSVVGELLDSGVVEELEDPKGKALEEARKTRDEIRVKVVDLARETQHNNDKERA